MENPFKDPGFSDIYDELQRTGVLSDEFKNRIVRYMLTGVAHAYNRGYDKGKEDGKKD